MDSENKRKTMLSEADKQQIKEILHIDPDSDILSPMVDYVFKRIFTADDSRSKTALIDLINSVLKYEGDEQIVDLTIVNPQIPVNRGTEKKSIFDIRAKYNSGKQATIEMQKNRVPDFKRRTQHTISKMYASQEISGWDYNRLEKCYLICIADFDAIEETSEYIVDYRFRDRNGKDLTDGETIIFLDLTKIEAVLEKTVDEMTDVEMWSVFFKHIADTGNQEAIATIMAQKEGANKMRSIQETLNKIIERKEGIKMAKSILLEVSADEAARAYYDSELMFELDQRGRMREAREEGEQIGRIEGWGEHGKETAYDMFIDGENMAKIKKYSKLPDNELAEVLSGLPTEIQARYNLCQ